MSANNFENLVQQKMDELLLQPTAQVWEEVERRIREKKRRRVIIFWFLFAGIALLGGGAWWMINKPGQKKSETGISALKQQNQSNINKTDKQVKENRITPVQPAVNSEANSKSVKEIILIKEKTIPQTFVAISNGNKKRKSNSFAKADNVGDRHIISSLNKIQTPVNAPVVAMVNMDKPAFKKNDPAPEADIVFKQPDVIKNPVENQNIDSADMKKPDEPVVIAQNKDSKKSKIQKSKWIFGLNAGIGSTRLTEGSFLDIGAHKSADAFSIPNTNAGFPPPVSRADSIPLKGLAWFFGISAKRNLGKKTAISIGIDFKYNSTKQRTGLFIDSVRTIQNDIRSLTSGGFYRSGSFNEFTNRYYFIQLPVLFHWQLNKGDKLPPLIWENGFSPSFLVGSNALVYDKQTSVFYKDKRVYNSFQLAYQTGLSAGLFKNKKHPLTAGLYYNYHISLLQRISPPRFNTLSSFGVKFNWTIKK